MNETIPEIPEALDTDVFITRAFAAPRDVVWRFFTEPALLATWFGPSSVHVDPATVKVELHPGGAWDLDMVDNETGEHYPFRSKLTAVIPPEYLEGGEVTSAEVGPADRISLRIWLHDHGPKTRLTLHQGPFTPEYRDLTRDGWLLSFDKIDNAIEEGIA
ncbi:MAG TPA: SRPBCC domain-containing protein [Rhodoglobus sp.]|nr:SRPBCC domain-containing protein [Rhodoglobus sp.]